MSVSSKDLTVNVNAEPRLPRLAAPPVSTFHALSGIADAANVTLIKRLRPGMHCLIWIWYAAGILLIQVWHTMHFACM